MVESSSAKKEGNAHFKRGDWKKAIICYTKALAFDSESAVLFTNRAMAHMKLQRQDLLWANVYSRWNDAIQDCSAAIELDKKAFKAYWRRGVSKRELGQISEALQGFLLLK